MIQKTITLPATLQAVSQFSADLDTMFASLPVDIRVGIVLAVQELCVNIVEHAYAGDVGDIQVEIDWSEQRLQMAFVDQAANAFTPPADIRAPDPLELPESGMGVFILYQSFDQVEYERLPNGNRWRLLKQMGD